MENLQKSSDQPLGLARFNEGFGLIKPGQNLLVVVNGVYSLLKYESHDTETEDYYTHRLGRNGGMSTVLAELLPYTEKERQEREERKRKEHKRLKGNIYGSHRIDFTFDEEFGIYLPSSSSFSSDLYFTLATASIDGKIEMSGKPVDIFAADSLIETELRKITRPFYFESVVAPFLESRPTRFSMPGYRRSWFKKRPNFWTTRQSFGKMSYGLLQGSFVYVGCKEEVYLLSLAKGEDGWPYTQGTYITSAKPMLYFSNNYLSFISKHDAEKPKAPKSMRSVNVAEYRTYDIPGFKGKPFIFPQMGRSQNCKNVIFTGRPEIITRDLAPALEHFATTDFAEFGDVVKSYAKRIHEIHPSSGKPNGKFYY